MNEIPKENILYGHVRLTEIATSLDVSVQSLRNLCQKIGIDIKKVEGVTWLALDDVAGMSVYDGRVYHKSQFDEQDKQETNK